MTTAIVAARTIVTPDSAAVEQAARTYLARRDRMAHPQGHTDRGGRWQPSDTERQSCCGAVRSPSRAWPWSLMVHCRTAEHVARLHDVDATAVRRVARRMDSN